jgi:5-methylcytosine-specific restriction endonuclease McrA
LSRAWLQTRWPSVRLIFSFWPKGLVSNDSAFRVMVDWNASPLRAERVAIALAKRSPFLGWDDPASSHRRPPLPFKTQQGRKRAGLESFRGRCYVCGQPVYPGGRFRGERSGRGTWHACCFAAYTVWVNYRSALRFLDPGCASCGRRGCILQADHKIPLYRVSRDHWAIPWYERLRFWGLSNIQALCIRCHKRKSKQEARDRRGKPTRPPQPQLSLIFA